MVQDTSFVYNQYVDMDEDTYNDYVAEVIRRSDVDSGIRPEYGEQLPDPFYLRIFLGQRAVCGSRPQGKSLIYFGNSITNFISFCKCKILCAKSAFILA